MTTSSLVRRAAASALGVYVYIALLTIIGKLTMFGAQPPWWLGASLFILLFVVSACVTGTLVLLKPVLLYVNGAKRDAVRLFAATVIAMAVIALVVGVVLVILYR